MLFGLANFARAPTLFERMVVTPAFIAMSLMVFEASTLLVIRWDKERVLFNKELKTLICVDMLTEFMIICSTRDWKADLANVSYWSKVETRGITAAAMAT